MVKERPNKMNISVMRQMIKDARNEAGRSFYISEDFGISYAPNGIFRELMNGLNQSPMLVEDYRIGFVIQGEIEATVNLLHRCVKPENMIFIGRGSIVQLKRVSPDLMVRGFIISPNLMSRIFSNRVPDIINGTVLAHVFDADNDDLTFLHDTNTAIWNLIQGKHYNQELLLGILSSVIYYMDMRYKQQVDSQRSEEGSNHNHEIFNRFIYLVNKYAREERSIGFYADKMCLSPRYLSTVIGQHSGQTAKEWIDQACINNAKVMLCHTEKSISQIADALKFPNDSFFCKYFRRLTGQSPTAYRNMK